MRTGSKILFIEDQTDIEEEIINCLEAAELISGDIGKREVLNRQTKGDIVIATSFSDAFERIVALGDGFEYEWIFIDRDLAHYVFSSEKEIKLLEYITSDSEDLSIGAQIFTKNFFNGLVQINPETEETQIFAGDYLFIMLVNAGVPIEKICFLTANNDASMEELRKSPYLHKKRLPEVISKDIYGYDELVEKLRDSHGSKVRFLYREIFENKKVKDIWGLYLEHFIALLAQRYSGEAYSSSQGITLRLMIEVGIPQTIPQQYAELSTRQFLNYKDVQYNISLRVDVDYRTADQKDQDLHNAWKDIVKNVGRNLLWEPPQDVENQIRSYNRRNKKSIKPRELINYDTARFLTALSSLYFSPPPPDLPPKYIFSYIDNIYTVTSEFSAHGKNGTTTDGLSSDGWSALLSGMLQIMQWVADKNPNPPSP